LEKRRGQFIVFSFQFSVKNVIVGLEINQPANNSGNANPHMQVGITPPDH
jgi:hypothetical protein